MSLDIRQLHRFVVRPALEHIGLAGVNAERLVIGTGLTESGLMFVDQKGRGGEQAWGPALGLWQMERATFNDNWQWLRARQGDLAAKVDALRCQNGFLDGDFWKQMTGNLFFAAAMCRVHYLRKPGHLPDTLEGMAEYWKRHYNSMLGAGKIEDFLSKAAPVMTLVNPVTQA